MTNKERADKLLREAEEVWRGISEDFRRRSFNLVIRRAQEVVELTLKALLCELGFDYPKIHDVAPLFRRVIEDKGLEAKEDLLMWLEKTSSSLASKRSPAFYFEADYDELEAEKAMDSAEKVLEFGRSFMKKLRGVGGI